MIDSTPSPLDFYVQGLRVAVLLLVPVAALVAALSASASYISHRLHVQDPGLLRFVRLLGVALAVVLAGDLLWGELEVLTGRGLSFGASLAGNP